MDEHKVYLELIDSLLLCPSGKEEEVLADNIQLVDGEFRDLCKSLSESESIDKDIREMLKQIVEILPV